MRDPKTIPLVAVEFRLADGEVLSASWSMADDGLKAAMEAMSEIPEWLDNPLMSWPHPQDPVTHSGDVKPGREVEAREFVAALAPAGEESKER